MSSSGRAGGSGGTKRVRLVLPAGRSSEIRIGSGILGEAVSKNSTKAPAKAFVIADRALAAHTRRLVSALKGQGWDPFIHEARADESFKDIRKIYPIYGQLLKHRVDRHGVIFALGGGVIGDAAGFIAGTYLRGIRWVGVPTTLLAQVDSSIGGKTGVNHEIGKNLIGVFHQPERVICDVSLLKTLPEREVVSGLGEIVKYGLTFDPRFFSSLERDWRRLLRLEAGPMIEAVTRCARYKAAAVARDELDRKGIREVLNFGHTAAHALEVETGYGAFRHGEAVILGMRVACRLSVLRGHLAPSVQGRIEAFLSSLPVPPLPAKLSRSRLLGAMRHDKKARGGKVRFVLLAGIGKTILDREVRDEQVLEALKVIRP